jgi:uncharacterized protein YecE (DUF72 family)
MGRLYLGTSGFGYDEWRGRFYPDDIKSAAMLGYYAGVFNSVEVIYTFRQFPALSTLRTWLDQTPEHFRFAIKAHRMITYAASHERALAGMADFLNLVRELGDRLGPVRFQFPPTRALDRGLLDEFLAAIPPGLPAAIEFRHESWRPAWPLLAEHGIARVVADTDEQPAQEHELSWQPFGYLRLRRSQYSDAELATWAERFAAAASIGGDIHCYFRHEDTAAGPRMARRLAELMG